VGEVWELGFYAGGRKLYGVMVHIVTIPVSTDTSPSHKKETNEEREVGKERH
jgi:hypothetical protein